MSKGDDYSQGVQYPLLSDTPNIETAMKTLVNGVVPLVVMKFANANARAAAFGTTVKLVPGMVTYLIAEDRWEGYQADGTWMLMSDGPWQSLSYVSGYAAMGGSPGWRLKAGGGIELRGRIRKTNGLGFTDDGTAVKFASIPSAYAPAAIRYFMGAATRSTSDGVTRYTVRLEVHTDGGLFYNAELGSAAGASDNPAWFALDGILFSPAGD
jgi:hypothetical protein